MLTIDDWIVAWNPRRKGLVLPGTRTPGAIHVAELGNDDVYFSHDYLFTSGMCYQDRHSMTLEAKVMMLFIDFHTIIVRDGVDPRAAHDEFLKIDEYRRRISPDIGGAE